MRLAFTLSSRRPARRCNSTGRPGFTAASQRRPVRAMWRRCRLPHPMPRRRTTLEPGATRTPPVVATRGRQPARVNAASCCRRAGFSRARSTRLRRAPRRSRRRRGMAGQAATATERTTIVGSTSSGERQATTAARDSSEAPTPSRAGSARQSRAPSGTASGVAPPTSPRVQAQPGCHPFSVGGSGSFWPAGRKRRLSARNHLIRSALCSWASRG